MNTNGNLEWIMGRAPAGHSACRTCGKHGHWDSQCRYRAPQALIKPCRYCNETSHWEENCGQLFFANNDLTNTDRPVALAAAQHAIQGAYRDPSNPHLRSPRGADLTSFFMTTRGLKLPLKTCNTCRVVGHWNGACTILGFDPETNPVPKSLAFKHQNQDPQRTSWTQPSPQVPHQNREHPQGRWKGQHQPKRGRWNNSYDQTVQAQQNLNRQNLHDFQPTCSQNVQSWNQKRAHDVHVYSDRKSQNNHIKAINKATIDQKVFSTSNQKKGKARLIREVHQINTQCATAPASSTVDTHGNIVLEYDSAGNPIVCYLESGQPVVSYVGHPNPILSFDVAGCPIIGYSVDDAPILGRNTSGPIAVPRAPAEIVFAPAPAYDTLGSIINLAVPFHDSYAVPVHHGFDDNGNANLAPSQLPQFANNAQLQHLPSATPWNPSATPLASIAPPKKTKLGVIPYGTGCGSVEIDANGKEWTWQLAPPIPSNKQPWVELASHGVNVNVRWGNKPEERWAFDSYRNLYVETFNVVDTEEGNLNAGVERGGVCGMIRYDSDGDLEMVDVLDWEMAHGRTNTYFGADPSDDLSDVM